VCRVGLVECFVVGGQDADHKGQAAKEEGSCSSSARRGGGHSHNCPRPSNFSAKHSTMYPNTLKNVDTSTMERRERHWPKTAR